MGFCTQCGAAYQSGASFCQDCGANLTEPPARAQMATAPHAGACAQPGARAKRSRSFRLPLVALAAFVIGVVVTVLAMNALTPRSGLAAVADGLEGTWVATERGFRVVIARDGNSATMRVMYPDGSAAGGVVIEGDEVRLGEGDNLGYQAGRLVIEENRILIGDQSETVEFVRQ